MAVDNSAKGMSVQEFVEQDVSIAARALQSHLNGIQNAYKPFRTVTDDFDANGSDGRLAGIPVSLKDQICTQAFPTTAGSKMLEDYRPPFDATVVDRLQQDGAHIIGKTNMDEFGFGTFCTNSAFEVPRNPHDTNRVVGGSSGGAGALTAAMEYPHIALAESTGGSISAPATFCGVVGMTPTYGRVSRYGLIDYGNSLDKIGTMADTVYGAALGLETIAGKDEQDTTTVDRPANFTGNLTADVDGMTIGVPTQYMDFAGVDDAVRNEVWAAIHALEDMGAEYEEVDMPKLAKDYTVPAYYIVAVAEASTNLARYCGMRYGQEADPTQKGFNEYFSDIRTEHFGDEVKRRIMLGTYARMAGYRSKYYLKALKVRRLVIDEFKQAFNEYDALAAPAMPIIAPTVNEADDLSPTEVYAMDTLTVGPNLAGMPHASVPCGTVDGMPAGMHLIGDHFEEQTVLNAAYAYESM
jgi:aspartyl-tRNA(Asn)/glutamyl-tRNA(Gln) amidotransferase subunit A